MGIIKSVILLTILLFFIFLSLIAIDGINSLIQEENKDVYQYAIEDIGFCENGKTIYSENKIVCEQEYSIITYSCVDTCNKTKEYKR